MIDTTETGLCLEVGGGARPVTSRAEINETLAVIGTRIWPLPLGGAPDALRQLLSQPHLSDSEQALLVDHFRLRRERLLEVIADAWRTPHVPRGGDLKTEVAGHDHGYPRLYLIEDGDDYSRFDRFHVNTADDGTGTDEIMQILAGGTIVLHQRTPAGTALTLHLACPSPQVGWMLTYDGARPHIGSLSGADSGTKVVMQIIGPKRWAIRYDREV